MTLPVTLTTRASRTSAFGRMSSTGSPVASLPLVHVTTPFATIEEAVAEIREGRMVVVVDDPARENEGDLTIAAQFATPEAINFMATHAPGLICPCLHHEGADQLC